MERAEEGEYVDSLAAVLRFYAKLGEDYPDDRGRVGKFLADVLMPSFIRALDVAKRDVSQGAAVGLQIVVGRILEKE